MPGGQLHQWIHVDILFEPEFTSEYESQIGTSGGWSRILRGREAILRWGGVRWLPTYNFAKFSKKLHEIENILSCKGLYGCPLDLSVADPRGTARACDTLRSHGLLFQFHRGFSENVVTYRVDALPVGTPGNSWTSQWNGLDCFGLGLAFCQHFTDCLD